MNDLYLSCINFAQIRVDWYKRKKKNKKRLHLLIRISALIFCGLGSAIPLIAAYIDQRWLGFGYPILAFGGGLFLLNHYLGLSSNWARFMLSSLQIEGLMQIYNIEWQGLNLKGDSPGVDFTGLSKSFINSVNAIVELETSRWIEDESSIMKELSFYAKTDK